MIQNITVIRTDARNCRCGQPAVTSIKPSKIALHMCQACADNYSEGYANAIAFAHSLKEGY